MLPHTKGLLLSLLILASSQVFASLLHSAYPPPTTIISSSNNQSSTSKNFGSGITLGYITPWNPKGNELTLRYRSKFDIIAPVWYTVHSILKEEENEPIYEVKGGPTNSEDEEWLKEIQKGEGSPNLSPRFFLDSWTEDDFLAFLSMETTANSLISEILRVIESNKYNGMVLESSAIWVLIPFIQALSTELHNRDKTLTVVLPPLRDPKLHSSISRLNELILKTVENTRNEVDYFSVMTYDSAGSGGLPFFPAALHLDPSSPLNKPEYRNIRLPGPNTPLDFISQNLELFSLMGKSMEDPEEFGINGNDNPQKVFQETKNSLESKILTGIPMYGYTYPIAWISTTHGASIPKRPPPSPIKSKDEDEEAQTKAREKAAKKEGEKDVKDLIPVLRASGDAITHDGLLEILKSKRPLVRLDERSQEGITDVSSLCFRLADFRGFSNKHHSETFLLTCMFNLCYFHPSSPTTFFESLKYTDILPADKGGSQTQEEPCYYRAYFPTSHTMKRRIERIQEQGGMGLALWDVGQASDWLLEHL